MSLSPALTAETYCDVLTQLLELLDRDVVAEPTHGRADQRYRVNAPVTLGVVPGDDAVHQPDIAQFKALHRGWATDLSPAGIGLLIEHELPANVTMHVNVEAMLGQPVVLPIRIVYCNQLLPHTYRIGGMFLLAE